MIKHTLIARSGLACVLGIRRYHILALLGATFASVSPLKAEVVIDYDTTIDNTIEDAVRIVEGANPPTTVRIVDGAHIIARLADSSVHDSSVVDMSGGEIRSALTAYDHSTVSISGGKMRWLLARDSSIVNVSGGSTDSLSAWGNSAVQFSGGFVLDDGLSANDSSTVSISGGHIHAEEDEAVQVRSTVDLSGGNISSGPVIELLVGAGGTANVFGYGLALNDNVLSGFLQDYNPLDHRVEILDGGQIVLHELPEPPTTVIDLDTTIDAVHSFPNRRVDIIDGVAPPTTVDIVPGGEVGLLSVQGRSVVNHRGSSVNTLLSREDAQINTSAGSVNWVEVNDFSTLTMTDGTIMGGLQALDASTVDIFGGSAFAKGDRQGLRARGSSTVNLFEGDISFRDGDGIVASDSSTVNISGGHIHSSGGNEEIGGCGILVSDAGTVNIHDGLISASDEDYLGLCAFDSSTVNIRGGRIAGADDSYGVIVSDSSTLNIFDGTISVEDDGVGMIVRDSGTVNVFGGMIHGDTTGLSSSGSSQVTIMGGNLDGVGARGSSVITIAGTDFNYPYGPVPNSSGTLTGILASGESINISFRIENGASIVLVPEPSTAVLLSLAAIGFLPCGMQRRKRGPSRSPVRHTETRNG